MKCQFDATLASIFTITALSNTAYSVIAPLLPFQYQEKNAPKELLGYVFAIYSLAVIVGSPLVGKLIPKLGRRNIILFGVSLMGIAFMCFGMIDQTSNTTIYILCTFIIRLAQGIASCCIQTTCFSICVNFYPERKEEMIGYIEAVVGFGTVIGPVLGSILFTIGGYKFSFFFFGIVFMLFSLVVKRILPPNLDSVSYENDLNHTLLHNQSDFGMEQHSHSQSYYQLIQQHNQRNIGYRDIICNFRFLFAALTGTLGYFLQVFFEPILALRLAEFNLNSLQIGGFFAILPVFYIFSSLSIQRIPKGFQKRAILILAIFISFPVNLIAGPSELFSFGNSLYLMAFGQVLHGLIDPFVLVPCLPEMVDASLAKFPGQEGKINDICASVFNSFLGLGQILGPLYGASMYINYGFRITCDVLALYCLFWAVLYFICCQGFTAFKESSCKKEADGVPMDLGHSVLSANLVYSKQTFNLTHEKIMNYTRHRNTLYYSKLEITFKHD